MNGIDSRRVSFSFNLHFLISRSSDPVALREAAQVIQSHLTKGDSPTFGPVTVRLVEYGLVRLRDRHEGQIVEPLAFLSLMKWFDNHPDLNLQVNLRTRLASQSRASGYEELIILYLLRALRYPVPFSTIFKFHGTIPQKDPDRWTS